MFQVYTAWGDTHDHRDADTAYVVPSHSLQLDDAQGRAVAIYAPGQWLHATRQPVPDKAPTP